jgi:hypothetical protein
LWIRYRESCCALHRFLAANRFVFSWPAFPPNLDMPMETFYGLVESTTDALLIFEACRSGLLPRAKRRLLEGERRELRSGSIYVFDEKESGIKRWTDGRQWSPSRILGKKWFARSENGSKNLMTIVGHRKLLDLPRARQKGPAH